MGREDLDDLLRPSLGGRTSAPSGRRPWRVGSQVYVAFFGGVIAVTAIALINATRLRMSGRALAGIALCGVLGLAAVIVLASTMDQGRDLRLMARVAAVVAWGGMYLIQRVPDRVYEYHSQLHEPHESLILPGLLACLGGGIVQVLLVLAISGEAA